MAGLPLLVKVVDISLQRLDVLIPLAQGLLEIGDVGLALGRGKEVFPRRFHLPLGRFRSVPFAGKTNLAMRPAMTGVIVNRLLTEFTGHAASLSWSSSGKFTAASR